MPKIAFIGAGSFVFTRGLVRDLLTYDLLKGSTLALMDIDPRRLESAREAVQILVDRAGGKARVIATLDRREALKGADAVVCTILAAPVSVWRHDIEIPMKYGVDMNVGDTRSVAGIFRAARTIPVMLSIVKDMERHCPGAILLNYTNPMAMLCRAMQKASPIRSTGLCHSVQGTAGMLARWIGADKKDVTYVCAGINHMAWYIEYKVKGKDAYPLIRRAVARRDIYRREIVRNEMFLALGYYVTESSGHNSEYNWWFRKRPELVRKYCLPGEGWNPGEHAYILKQYLASSRNWRSHARKMVLETRTMSMDRGGEYAAGIINAFMGGEMCKFNGNVPNTAIITNLPADACVEVPVVATRRGFEPIHVGPLPPQCAAMNNITVAVEEMAVEASMTGDPTLLYRAMCYDPLTAAVLDLRQIKKMTADLLRRNHKYLPQFKTIDI